MRIKWVLAQFIYRYTSEPTKLNFLCEYYLILKICKPIVQKFNEIPTYYLGNLKNLIKKDSQVGKK